MQYRSLGSSGLKLSCLSLGSWVTFGKQVNLNDAKALIKTAYDAGINFFDNAEGYEAGIAEELMGNALSSLGLARDSFVVSSKVFWGGDKPTQRGLCAKHIKEACEAACRRLHVEYLDLYFCHRPDIETPIEETVRAMHNLVAQGKVLYWGTSEWNAQQITQAHAVARAHHLTPPTMEQPQYNMFCRDRIESEYLPLYETYGLGTTIFSPLASGILTGKYNDGVPEGSRLGLADYQWLKDELLSEGGQWRIDKAREVTRLAQDLDLSPTSLALAWCLKNPHVSSVILGASKHSQLVENLGCLAALDLLTDEAMERIDALLGNRPVGPQGF